jgi:hydrogenase maturation protease
MLYEGYVLYPYRASSVKNRRRWTFGALFPRAFCAAHETGDASRAQAQALVEGGPSATVGVVLRFLHVAQVHRAGVEPTSHDTGWQEAVERQVALPPMPLAGGTVGRSFTFGPTREADAAGGLVRRHERLDGVVTASTERLADGLTRVTVAIDNVTACASAQGDRPRDAAEVLTLASTHLVLTAADGGAFVSTIDPPARLRERASGCRNVGLWPVLVGPPGSHEVMLAAPIILHDHPAVAPESPGDLFDATEIDEILTLRILTLTEDERREVLAGDPRARALLERTEALGPGTLAALHGARRSPSRAGPGPRTAAHPSGVVLRAGDRVRLRPRQRGADAMDVVLRGLAATIESIEVDLEDRAQVSVTIDDDPGRDLGAQGLPGHRFYFDVSEVEPA